MLIGKNLVVVIMLGMFFVSLASAIDVNVDSGSVVQGQQITINVNVNSTYEIFGGQFDILYDGGVLDFVSVQQGNYLTSDGGGSFDSNSLGGIDSDVSDGVVNSFVVLRNFSATSGVAGSEVFFSVTFSGRVAGAGYVNVSNIIWSNSSAGRINDTAETIINGVITVTSPPSPPSGDNGGSSGGSSGGGGSVLPRRTSDEVIEIEPPEVEEIGEGGAPELRSVVLSGDVSYVNVGEGERVVLDFPETEIDYIVSFSVRGGEVYFSVLDNEYRVEKDKLMRVVLDEQAVYLGVTELAASGENAVVALGLDEEAVRGEVAVADVGSVVNYALLAVMILIIIVAVIIVVLSVRNRQSRGAIVKDIRLSLNSQ